MNSKVRMLTGSGPSESTEERDEAAERQRESPVGMEMRLTMSTRLSSEAVEEAEEAEEAGVKLVPHELASWWSAEEGREPLVEHELALVMLG
mmetsp:Transcript_21940/g.70047  ORF Transcript_21940/g.70047 Transcript_21940/m.70047 type:complete len:92 (-) Transcript_21940:144-419(-)